MCGIFLSTAGFAPLLPGCASEAGRVSTYPEISLYPPPPDAPRVVALGNLRSGRAPTQAEVDLAVFLFGVEPGPPRSFIRPMAVAPGARGLLVCDGGLGAVLRWDVAAGEIQDCSFAEPPALPVAVETAPDGHMLIADARAGAVLHCSADGRIVRRHTLTNAPFRPAGVLSVREEIWVTNVAGQKIEVFDSASGRHLRGIGRRGGGPGEFGMPLGLAATPDGHVCVVDMLNNRVQVLDRDGRFIRSIGQGGDVAGAFGRPKDVAVGPDGTIFVTDASSQRVHAFDAQGRALLAFGDQRDPIGGLSMPNGLCVALEWPGDLKRLPPGFLPAYYIFVAEQLMRPGIRVYAWGRLNGAGPAVGIGAWGRGGSDNASGSVNPHWNATSCNVCHDMAGGTPQPLPAAGVDRLCLSCHDGRKARSEAHPVGRLASGRDIQLPKGWPVVEGRLGCVTCHDIRGHCSTGAQRPFLNPALLRGFEPDRPLEFCRNCHNASDSQRISPHRNLDAQGRVDERSCGFCHTSPMLDRRSGIRTGESSLHDSSSRLCLSCHTRHWDASPTGHVDRAISDSIRRTLLARAYRSSGDGATSQPAERGQDWLGRLPLGDGRVTCYTCHNPHQRGLFPPDSPLGALVAGPEDGAAALRMSTIDLCMECHAK